VGVVAALERRDDTARLRIEWQRSTLAQLLIPKGSVAVDGVSLTVAALDERAFEVMLIPHTLALTTLGRLSPGWRVNLEMDMIGKYVVRVLSQRGNGS
jgi:riboflavin synthase